MLRVVSPNSSFANDIGTHLTTQSLKNAEQMAELTVWALTKSMHASELDVAAMQDILVIILKASLLALQNKALDVSELLVEDGASSDSEVDEES